MIAPYDVSAKQLAPFTGGRPAGATDSLDGVLKILYRSGMSIETTTDAGAVHVDMTVIDDAPKQED